MSLPLHLIDDISTLRRLIKLTCDALEKPLFDKGDIIPLEQSFRFLEQYRYDAFEWRDSHAAESTFEWIARKRAQDKTYEAFLRAGKDIFPNLEREEIALQVEGILTSFCKDISVDRTVAKRFFAVVKQELEKTP